MGNKKRKHNDDYEYDPAPKHLQISHIKNQEKRLIIVLENAQLESVKVRLYFIYGIFFFLPMHNIYIYMKKYHIIKFRTFLFTVISCFFLSMLLTFSLQN